MNTIWGSLGGNLIGTLYFLFFQIIGFLFAQFILRSKSLLTRALCGSVLGSVLLAWIPALFAFFFDFSIISHICAVLLCYAVILILFLLRLPHAGLSFPAAGRIKYTLGKHRVFLIISGFTFALFCVMLSTHSFPMLEDGMHTGQCTYGDMNMHLGFITSIARQQTFPPYYSIAPGTKLSYPFLCDSISSSIYIWGASLRWAYMLPMYFAFLQVITAFYSIAFTWFKKASEATFAWFLFFFNGGMGVVYFIDWSNERLYTFRNIFTEYYQTPTNLINNNIRWVNIIVDMLLPQRATLFGYAVLFTCIWLLWRCAFNKEYDLFPVTAVLTASLPMIHTHSFLAMGIISACWLLVFLMRGISLKHLPKYPGRILLTAFLLFMCTLQILVEKGLLTGSAQLLSICIAVPGILIILGLRYLLLFIRQNGIRSIISTWGIYLCIILLLALPQLCYWTFSQTSNDGFLTGHFNWGNLGDNYLWFYIKNWGIILLLLIPAICHSTHRDLGILTAGFFIWFIVELVCFSPNPYDNNKLLYVAYAFFCCISAKYGCYVYRRIKSIPGTKIWCTLFLFLCSVSGILSVIREVISDHTLYSAAHVAAAVYVDQNTPVDSTFLTSDRHVNEIAALTGRNIVSGSPSFLGPHGVYDDERAKDVQTMFESPKTSENLFQQYSVDYIMISSWERSCYNLEEDVFDTMFECVYEGNEGEIKIYKIS